ncbi:MAG: GDYXXLXY domain-containing protein [Gammaproteobacteria bacterium]|nr:GDYXXLXY domain-containing protein [Gammaproteobacteria bacterium]
MLNRIFNLQDRARTIVLAVTIATVLLAINVEIAGKEKILRNGTTVLLRIAPRDPRSLLQGDYMALRYTMAGAVASAAERFEMNDGTVVIELGELNEAKFVSLYKDQPLQDRQHLLRYRKRGDSVRLASDAYFFEEGSEQEYRDARYGEIRINTNGDAVLIGLRDAEGERLGSALHQK